MEMEDRACGDYNVPMTSRRSLMLINGVLLFASGAAGLIYEVLWMKQLGLLFGNTTYAAATTLSAFFLGLAAGGWFWGRRAARMSNPLRSYASLEVGIALTALLYFALLPVYHWVYPHIFRAAGLSPLATAAKFALSVLAVFPPAFFMGGTIPVMGQHLIRDVRRFGATGALLYGLNTLGAALGAYLAGFHLPLWLGYRATYGVATCITCCVAVVAWLLSRGQAVASSDAGRGVSEARATTGPALPQPFIAATCFLSGFGVLGLEVLWTRMFAQVLTNSVYTFAAVLVTILMSLALGAGVAAILARLPLRPAGVLFGLLVAAALAAGTTPLTFMHVTDNMRIVSSSTEWSGYIMDVFTKTIRVIGVPACLLGTIFPYLLKTCESRVTSTGWTLGSLLAINTVGGIGGALFAGFVLLDWVGLWPGLQIYSLLYLLPAMAFPLVLRRVGAVFRVATAGVVAVAVAVSVYDLDPSGLDRVALNEIGTGETLMDLYEGSGGTVAVTDTFGALAIKLNNHYGLGSTAARQSQETQADIPLMIRPKTPSIYFLGMGTGITPGASLAPYYRVRRVVTCELVGEVVTAAREHFAPHVNGLFTDPRSQIVIDDGRHYLLGAGERFDLICADLFVPSRSGAGSLYTVEHFRTVRRRLKPGGWFVQWLPAYQMTRREFGIVARTMLEAFDQVTLWRNSFFAGQEIIALVGHPRRGALPVTAIDDRAYKAQAQDKVQAVEGIGADNLESFVPRLTAQTALTFYCGNLSAIRDRFDGYAVNTDDYPLIEYLAPLSRQRQKAGEVSWFVGGELLAFLGDLQKACPPESDPMLANHSPADRRLPRAGLCLHRARMHSFRGQRAEAQQAWADFVRHWLARDAPTRRAN